MVQPVAEIGIPVSVISKVPCTETDLNLFPDEIREVPTTVDSDEIIHVIDLEELDAPEAFALTVIDPKVAIPEPCIVLLRDVFVLLFLTSRVPKLRVTSMFKTELLSMVMLLPAGIDDAFTVDPDEIVTCPQLTPYTNTKSPTSRYFG